MCIDILTCVQLRNMYVKIFMCLIFVLFDKHEKFFNSKNVSNYGIWWV